MEKQIHLIDSNSKSCVFDLDWHCIVFAWNVLSQQLTLSSFECINEPIKCFHAFYQICMGFKSIMHYMN